LCVWLFDRLTRVQTPLFCRLGQRSVSRNHANVSHEVRAPSCSLLLLR
jgi:hypothetical protein